MRYLIKLEDRDNGRETLVECPANMLLEEFSIKIKVGLHLPYTDLGAHCFMKGGRVYVPDVRAISELWEWSEVCLPMENFIQQSINYPRGRDIRSTERYRLKQVFTVLQSAVTYDQKADGKWSNVRCTLMKRLP